jgi:ribosomal protein S27AE
MITVLYPDAPYSILVEGNREYPEVAIMPRGKVPNYCPRCGKVLIFTSEPIYHSHYGWFCGDCELVKDRQ